MMFRKATNIVLITLVALFLCGTIGLKAASEMGVAFPDFMAIGKTNSSLEGRDYEIRPTPTPESVASGTFQTKLEQYLADITSIRDRVLLENASMQRACIAIANGPIGFFAYPTYFGSDTSVVPAYGLIVPNASKPNAAQAQAADELTELLDRLASEHPDTHFVYDAMRSPYDSEYNPTYDYCSSVYTKEWVESHILNNLTASNITAVYDPIESFDELESLWHTTEHHWTLERALRSYSQIAAELGLRDYAYEGAVPVVETWYGARCRLGRDLEFASEFYDMPTDFSEIEWLDARGNAISYGKRDAFLEGESPYPENGAFNVYDSYYGIANVEAINHGSNNGCTCLVICVSYTKALKGYIASNYERTLFIDPDNNPTNRPLSDYLDEGFDDVIIQLGCTSYAGIKSHSPGLLS